MPAQIVDDVYDITCADAVGRVRAYLFDYDRPTLFDTGLADTTDALHAGIDEVGVEPERLVVTHGDPDHVGGYDSVVDAYDVETFVPEEMDGEFETEPDHRYGDGDAIGPFEAVHVPGHTAGASALVDEDRELLVAGDTLVGADWRGLPAGYVLAPPEYFSADVAEAERNVERLLDYRFETILVFHGSSVVDDGHEKLDAYVNFPGKGR